MEKNSIGPYAISEMPSCQIISPNNEDNEIVWQNITSFLNSFKCAKIQGSNYYDTYVVCTRTILNFWIFIFFFHLD